MKVLSHRGYWKEILEKNQSISFERSFSLGFGTETDIRDYKGQLIISHDIADENCISVKEMFEIYNKYDNTLPLALNIKADGTMVKLTDPTKLHSLGWKHKVELEDGIRTMYEWYKNSAK